VFRRLSWLWILVIGIVLFEAIRHVLIDTQNPNLFPALLLIGAATVPAAFVAFIAHRRLAFDIPSGPVLLVAVLGGVVGVVVAGLVEYATLRRLGVLPMIGVGAIEEAAKLLAPLAVVLFTRYQRPADGLLVGVASGAGFAALETMGYGFVQLVASRGDLNAVTGILEVRGLLSPAAHMAWTGLTAAALWHAADRGWRGRPLAGFIAVFVIAVALHATWDSVGSTTAYAILAAVSLALLAIATHRLHEHAVTGRPIVPRALSGAVPART
jgi:protease PrsW